MNLRPLRGGFLGSPQNVEWELIRLPLTITEERVVRIVLFAQYQFREHEGKPQEIGLDVFAERGIDPRGALRAMDRLEEAGILLRVKSGVGQGHRTAYAIRPPAEWRTEVGGPLFPEGGKRGRQGANRGRGTSPNRGQGTPEKGGQGTPIWNSLITMETSGEPKRQTSSVSSPATSDVAGSGRERGRPRKRTGVPTGNLGPGYSFEQGSEAVNG